MISYLGEIFSKLIGTLAVILVVSAFIGGSDILSKFVNNDKRWKYCVIAGLLGGVFGIYGTLSGFNFNGALISVRDIGPMLAGYTGGPIGGLIAGIIAGVHRLTLGGSTANACVVATCCIGLICGLISLKRRDLVEKPYFAFLLSAVMEAFHLGVLLLLVRPFKDALDIVGHMALPFIAVNAIGFMMMIAIISYTERQRAIAAEKSRLQSELEVASVIQHSLLPRISDAYPGCLGILVGASMEAAKEVGGDFYDVFFVDSSHLAFVIGDVSGKGVPAALFMASSKITLQNCVRDVPVLSSAIETANNALCDGNDAEMFLTLWVGVLDLESGELTFVSAGHNPPVLLRNGEARYLKYKNGFVLGGMEGMKYKEQKIGLEKGDIVYLYTDGVTEAEDKSHELFGDDRLLGCFEGRSGDGPQAIIENVKASVEDFIKGNSQFDDMTMLCFKLKKDD